jgi:predicted nucleic acid-binding protein
MTLIDTNILSTYLKRDANTRCPRLFTTVTALLEEEGLSISFITRHELRRGVEELMRRGEGRRKLVELEKFLYRAEVLGLDSASGEGWDLAARLWADGRAQRPAIVFEDADLFIAATAAFHGRNFATSDRGLVENLKKVRFPTVVHFIPSE